LHEGAFLRGVDFAVRAGNVLHAAFTTRTMSLLGRLAEDEAPSYLSGLLIGEELRSQDLKGSGELVITGADKLTQRYGLALSHIGATFRALGHEATWLGLHAIALSLDDAA
jgi:2-dehydro-3-deoxygalactonokinase